MAEPSESAAESAPAAESAKRRKSPFRRLVRRWLVFAGFLYIAWCVTLYFYQDKMLFPADLAPLPTPALYDRTTVELRVDIGGGEQAVAWFMPALASDPVKPAPLVIYFHGNAEIIDYQSTAVEGYRKLGCAVLLPEYRGYGRSGGKPSEEGILADSVRFFDQAIKRPDVDAARVLIHGRSLGGGPAAQLAGARKPRGLILESTFSSVAAMAHDYLAPECLARNPFRTDRVLAGLDVPVLIFHGTDDDIIPVWHGRALRDLAKNGTYVEYVCGHNDFPGDANEDAYWEDIASFLNRAGVIGEATH
jgi:fermentation-respiration switch protein FrsA (DUF1100 family)